MITPEQLSIACVAFSFFGALVGYWLCLAVNKPRNDTAPEIPQRPFNLNAEIERMRKEVAEAKRKKRAYADKERKLQIMTAWSL